MGNKQTATKVLFVGESWIKHTIHMKGFDQFTNTQYEEGAGHFLSCMDEAGFDITYIRAHEVSLRFPRTAEEMDQFDVVVISDIGSNSFLLVDETFFVSKKCRTASSWSRILSSSGAVLSWWAAICPLPGSTPKDAMA